MDRGGASSPLRRMGVGQAMFQGGDEFLTHLLDAIQVTGGQVLLKVGGVVGQCFPRLRQQSSW